MSVEMIESASEIDAEKVATIDIRGTLVDKGECSGANFEINTALGLDPETENEIFHHHKNSDTGSVHYMGHAGELSQAIEEADETGGIQAYAEAIQEIFDERSPYEGAERFVDELSDAGYLTMAVSSSPKAIVRRYAEELGLDTAYLLKDYIFDKGEFDHVFINPETPRGKADLVEILQGQGAEVVHFGDGRNDVRAVNVADDGHRQWGWDEEGAFEEALEETGILEDGYESGQQGGETVLG